MTGYGRKVGYIRKVLNEALPEGSLTWYKKSSEGAPMTDTRHIRQTFHRTSGLELRSTWQSTQAYKRHSHSQLSIGAIVEGQTCCVCHDREYILNPGDLIVIPACAPHSCNPVAGQPRSYHMLYIDTGLPLALQVIRSPTLFAHYLDVVEQSTRFSPGLPPGQRRPPPFAPPALRFSRRYVTACKPRRHWTP